MTEYICNACGSPVRMKTVRSKRFTASFSPVTYRVPDVCTNADCRMSHPSRQTMGWATEVSETDQSPS